MSGINEVPGNEAAAATDNVLSVTQETMVLAVTKSTKKPEAALGFGILKEGNALWKKAKGVKKDDGTIDESGIDTEILQTITVTYPVVHSLAGISEIVADEDEAVNLFNAGADQKLMSQLRAKFTQVTEGGDLVNAAETSVSVDQASEFIAAPLKRRSLTDSQKAVKVLKDISPEALAEALKAMGIIA